MSILKNEVVVIAWMTLKGYLREKVWSNRSNALEARRPRCFQGLSGAELGLDYESGAKAWMNSAIFFDWLQRFDAMIGQTPGRCALLFVDNASSHGTPTHLSELQHTSNSNFYPRIPPHCCSRSILA